LHRPQVRPDPGEVSSPDDGDFPATHPGRRSAQAFPTTVDLSKFEQFEAERLDLRKDAEQRGPILEQTGEHGLTAFQLRHHRGKSRQSGSSEPAPYPDRVQARRCGHAIIVQPDLVSRRRQNLVIVQERAV
jgi:hypothetical protein